MAHSRDKHHDSNKLLKEALKAHIFTVDDEHLKSHVIADRVTKNRSTVLQTLPVIRVFVDAGREQLEQCKDEEDKYHMLDDILSCLKPKKLFTLLDKIKQRLTLSDRIMVVISTYYRDDYDNILADFKTQRKECSALKEIIINFEKEYTKLDVAIAARSIKFSTNKSITTFGLIKVEPATMPALDQAQPVFSAGYTAQ